MTDSNAEGKVDQLQAEIERLKRENEKLRASNRRWMRIAGTDALTGLPNKVFFTTALLPQFINKANAESVPFSCLILAPDGLGEINQRHGREGGDQIVKEMATFLKENLEKGERLVHFDGANFVIMIPEGDLAVAKRRVLALRARVLSRPFPCGGEGVNLTICLGSVARSPDSPESPKDPKEVIETFVNKLTAVLDQAKKQGRDKQVEDPDTEF